VEKGHKAGSIVKRFHRHTCPDQLRIWAFLNEAKTLVQPGPKELAVVGLRSKFDDCLLAAKRVRFTGRNVYCSKLLKAATATSTWSLTDKDNQQLTKNCIVTHNAAYSLLPKTAQDLLCKEAAAVKRQRVSQHLDDSRQAHAAVVLLESQEAAFSEEPGGVFRLRAINV
jgi:hypothetical protein